MRRHRCWLIPAIALSLAACDSPRRADAAVQLELADRCQQMGERFVREIRAGDERTGIPVENREFTSRSHYNTVEKKCLVLTEGSMTMPLGIGRVMMTQIWDAALGVGGPIVAERDVPFSLDGGIKFYRGKQEAPSTPATTRWFEELMTK